MTNKLNIDRQRLFKAGYNRYLRSLSHGALVDFILNGGDLAFDNQQERDLLLAEVEDQKGRHARATSKINELIHQNRSLQKELDSRRPVDTASVFRVGEKGVTSIDVSHCTSVEDFMDALFGRCTCDDEEPITTLKQYAEVYPDAAVLAVTAAIVDTPLPDETIRLCAVLEEEFAPFITVDNLYGGLLAVSVVFPNTEAAKTFSDRAAKLGVSGLQFGLYVVNHTN